MPSVSITHNAVRSCLFIALQNAAVSHSLFHAVSRQVMRFISHSRVLAPLPHSCSILLSHSVRNRHNRRLDRHSRILRGLIAARHSRNGHRCGLVIHKLASLLIVHVLTWVDSLVFESLDELVEGDREQGTEEGSNPVNPVVAGEFSSDDRGAEGAGRVERAASEIDAYCIKLAGAIFPSRNLKRDRSIPDSSHMKRARPMPTGAMKVALCFSAANMKMVKTSSAVRNISMKRPRAMEHGGLVERVVRTARGPGKRADTMPAAAMPPSIWATKTTIPLIQEIAPMRHMPRVTCGGVSAYRGRTSESTYSWVEETSGNTKEDPGVDCEREAES